MKGPSMTRFFVLDAPGLADGPLVYGRDSDEHRYGKATWDKSMVWEYHLHHEGASRVLVRCHRMPLAIVIPSRRAVADFVWTWFSECLITERILGLFHDLRLSGFSVRTVTISKFKRKSADDEEVPNLLELEVYGKGGPPHPDSGSLPLPEIDGLGLRRYSSYKNGLLVNEKEWDGSDFFHVEGHPMIIVTERVRRLIESERLSNCVLVPAEKLVWPARIPRPEDQLARKPFTGPPNDLE